MGGLPAILNLQLIPTASSFFYYLEDFEYLLQGFRHDSHGGAVVGIRNAVLFAQLTGTQGDFFNLFFSGFSHLCFTCLSKARLSTPENDFSDFDRSRNWADVNFDICACFTFELPFRFRRME